MIKNAIIVIGALNVDVVSEQFTKNGYIISNGAEYSADNIVVPVTIPCKIPLDLHINNLRLNGYAVTIKVVVSNWTDMALHLKSSGIVKTEQGAMQVLEDMYNQIFRLTITQKISYSIEVISKQNATTPEEKVSNRNFKDDEDKNKHGLDKHFGTIAPNVPMLFSRHGHNLWLEGHFRGRSAFLILGGPSLKELDIQKLYLPGIFSMAVNNAIRTVRANLWTSVDDPSHFIKSIWLDPKIMKFVPYSHSEKFIFDNQKWEKTNIRVGDCPNMIFFKRNEKFVAEQFLNEDTFNWGNHSDLGGGRSVMLVAIRLLYYLGFRKVYLLGCDFDMSEQRKYHFEQDRSEASIKGNNSTYEKLISRFT
jgi:hypothetical protein